VLEIMMREAEPITVRVLKYDGAEYRRWNARVARREGPLIVLHAEFEFDVQHHLLGDIRRGTRTIEYYWLDRWYNVFQFLEPDGSTRLYYCNINTPPALAGEVLSYIDLDIDVVVQPDLSFEVVDEDEFEHNAAAFGYLPETVTAARAAVRELVKLIESRLFPFSGPFEPSAESFGNLSPRSGE
jgi:protein associated with RNAse G/E